MFIISEFLNQGYKTEKLFIALNKLAQNQSLHLRYNTLFYILFLTFEYPIVDRTMIKLYIKQET